MLLEYLITSRARRALLAVLWAERAEGSVSELARRAGVVTSAAEKELGAMATLGLVVTQRVGTQRRVRANFDSPHARLLRELLVARPSRRTGPALEAVRTWLAHYGAPLQREENCETLPSLEEALVEGLRASRLDAGLARALPIVFWRNRDALELPLLVRLAVEADQAQVLGFFLDLTSELTGDPRFVEAAASLRDRRIKRDTYFFVGSDESELSREVARENSPGAARRWHFFMNAPLDSFESMLRKANAVPRAV